MRVSFSRPRALRAGGFWLPELAQGIAEATAFILLIGEKGIGPWQAMEYYEALDRRVTMMAQSGSVCLAPRKVSSPRRSGAAKKPNPPLLDRPASSKESGSAARPYKAKGRPEAALPILGGSGGAYALLIRAVPSSSTMTTPARAALNSAYEMPRNFSPGRTVWYASPAMPPGPSARACRWTSRPDIPKNQRMRIIAHIMHAEPTGRQ